MRSGQLLGAQPAHLRPADGTAVRGQHHARERWDLASANILDQLYPAANTAGTRGTSGQPMNNYLINPVKERQDNQFDVKVDHNLSTNNRFFGRYSYEKTHRLQPATLPHGDAGQTFGAGDGNIKAQGFAFNDTHTFGSNWLNEARFGWTSIKFFMTSIDYGENLAAKVGIPGINTAPATSAMSQLTFQNIRNLGSNSNQPLITNQNDFQMFDNVTWIKGRHTLKTGGSLTLRSREVLNADNPVGQFQFNNNQTSNCAGQPASCVLNSNTGWDVASFLLGYTAQNIRNLSGVTASGDIETYTEKRPEFSVYTQDDWRATSKLTLNLGLRWDVYPPWLEVDDRQSNFDVTTGAFVLASDSAQIGGIDVGRRLQTYRRVTSDHALASPTTCVATGRRSSGAATACSGISRRAAPRRRRRRISRSCSRLRKRPRRCPRRRQPAAVAGPSRCDRR